MTTLDLRSWAPTVTPASVADEDYTGRHRPPGHRRDHTKSRFSIARMHYTPRHLR